MRTLVVLGLLAVFAAPPARAARVATRHPRLPAPLSLSVVQVSDSALTLDSNSPATAGPHAMYVSYRISNTSGASVANLSATLAGFSGGIALAGGQSATQYVGTLAAGQSRTVYWFITYPSTFGVRNVLTVNVSDGAGGTASGSGPVTTLSMISAQAGGLTSSSSIGAGAVVGQVIPLDVTFQFKGWKAGDTFNLQPAGNASFPAGCFQLVRDSITSADANLSSVIVPGTTNQTYFVASVASVGGGSTWNVSVRYFFRYLCSGTTATPLPYSNELSGGQLKYSANYGTGAGVPAPIPPAPSPSASFALTKTASAIQLPTGGSETYTVAIRNLSTFDVTVDSIRDVLPAGVSYVGVTAASGVTAANASAMPASGATGAIVWRGTPGSSFAIAAGATLNLVYTTTVTTTAGQYVNGASGYVGTTSIGSGSATVTVGTADVAVAKSGMSAAAMSDTLKYAISLSNAGPATAYQVVARDSLPAGVTFIRATNGGSYAGGIVTWPAVASLNVGATVVDSVLVLAPATLGTLVNVASASSPSYDPSAANNDGSAAGSRASTTLTIAIAVSPKGTGTAAKRLPGTRYAEVFTVSNVAGLPGTYNLIAAKAGAPAFLQIDSITGAGITTHVRPDSAQVTLGARSATPYSVWYSVSVGDTALNTTILRASNVALAATKDTGWVQLRRSFPTLGISKSVSPTGTVSAGIDLTYTTRFSNTGEYDATAVVLTDDVPPLVAFKLGSVTSSLPAGMTAAVSYSNDGGTTWTYTPTAGGCGVPVAYDGCVTTLRYTLTPALAPSATQSTIGYVARVR